MSEGQPKRTGKDFASMATRHTQEATTMEQPNLGQQQHLTGYEQQSPQQQPPIQLQQLDTQLEARQVSTPKRSGKDFAAMARTAQTSKAAHEPAASPPPAQQPQQPLTPTGGKPKGKDFAALAMRERPKGKDFGAMAARLPQMQQQPSQTPAVLLEQPLPPSENTVPPPLQNQLSGSMASDEVRQRQIDAARRAAGYTPLSPETITLQQSAAKKLKELQAQQQAQQQQAQQHAQQQAQVQLLQVQQQAEQLQAQQAQQQQAQPPSQVQRATSQTQRRPSGKQTVQLQQQQQLQQPQQTVPQQQPPKPISTKPTPQPKASESRIGAAHMAPFVGQRLQDLLNSIDPNYTLDAQAQEEALRLAQNFMDCVVQKSIRISQHRGSKTLDVQDVQFVLAKQWGIVVPGLGPPTQPPARAPAAQKRKSTSSTGSVEGNAEKKGKLANF